MYFDGKVLTESFKRAFFTGNVGLMTISMLVMSIRELALFGPTQVFMVCAYGFLVTVLPIVALLLIQKQAFSIEWEQEYEALLARVPDIQALTAKERSTLSRTATEIAAEGFNPLEDFYSKNKLLLKVNEALVLFWMICAVLYCMIR